MSAIDDLLSGGNEGIYNLKTKAAGPSGRLPLTEEMLRNSPTTPVFPTPLVTS